MHWKFSELHLFSQIFFAGEDWCLPRGGRPRSGPVPSLRFSSSWLGRHRKVMKSWHEWVDICYGVRRTGYDISKYHEYLLHGKGQHIELWERYLFYRNCEPFLWAFSCAWFSFCHSTMDQCSAWHRLRWHLPWQCRNLPLLPCRGPRKEWPVRVERWNELSYHHV